MMANRWFRIIAFVLILGISFPVCVATVSAQEGGGEPAAAADDNPMNKNIFEQGGTVGWVIVLLSVIGVTLVGEHFFSIRREKIAPPQLIDELDALFQEEDYDEALALCEREPNFLTSVVGAGLPKLAAGYDAMEEAMREAGEQESVKLHQKISYLNLIGSLSPMLGLLGTVTGMIGAFKVIATKDNPKPKELAGDIATALVTTMFGLVVAIPLVSFYFFFKNKVIRLSTDINNVAMELMERFRPIEE